MMSERWPEGLFKMGIQQSKSCCKIWDKSHAAEKNRQKSAANMDPRLDDVLRHATSNATRSAAASDLVALGVALGVAIVEGKRR